MSKLDKLNNKLKKSFALNDKELLRLENESVKVLITDYKASLKNIKSEIADFMEKYPEYSDMIAYKRLVKLKDVIATEIKELTKSSKKNMRAFIPEHVLNGYNSYSEIVGGAVGIDFASYGKADALNKYNQYSEITWLDAVDDNEYQTLRRMNSTITQGVIEGESYQKIAQNMTDQMDKAYYRMERIARTEIPKAQTFGRQLGFEEAQKSGLDVVKVWISAHDKRVRPNHEAMDGKEAIYGEDKDKFKFTTMDGTILVDAPHLTNTTDDINCLPGNTFVLAKGINKGTKRYYEGNLIEITTRDTVITASPNHPILTDKGFVPFNLIDKNSNIVNCRFKENVSTPNPNPNYRPIRFDELLSFLNVTGFSKRVRGVRPQFHGDGFNSDVDIISLKGFLRNWVESVIFKNADNRRFSFANFAKSFFFSESRFIHFTFRTFATLASLVARFKLLSPRFFGHIEPFNPFRLGLTSSIDSILTENPGDNSTTDIETFCEGVFGNPVDIIFNNPISIRKYYFSGHLYNLETVNEFYLGNTIKNNDNHNILHNCRCSMVTQFNNLEN